jgi:hypothetical protein
LLFATESYTPSKSSAKATEIVNALEAVGTDVKNALTDSVIPSALRALKALQFPANINAVCALPGGVEAIFSIDHQARRLIIGKALSYARQGEPFDIVLGGQPGI